MQAKSLKAHSLPSVHLFMFVVKSGLSTGCLLVLKALDQTEYRSLVNDCRLLKRILLLYVGAERKTRMFHRLSRKRDLRNATNIVIRDVTSSPSYAQCVLGFSLSTFKRGENIQ